jgi:hypothetical protein
MTSRARPAFVDDVTGLLARPGTGARASGRLIARLDVGGEKMIVDVGPEDVDWARQTVPILAGRVPEILERARRDIEAQQPPPGLKPLRRAEFDSSDRMPSEKLLAKLGVRTTFDRPAAALAELAELGDWDLDALDGVDTGDEIREWMKSERVDKGAKTAKVGTQTVVKRNRPTEALEKTPAGRRISKAGSVGGHGFSGREQLTAALLYVLGRAKGRRWSAVDWGAVESVIQAVNQAIDDSSERVTPLSLVLPLGLGPRNVDDFENRLRATYGPEAADTYALMETSGRLWRIADELERLASPPRGKAGEGARAQRKCLSKDELSRLPSRRKQVEKLASRPWLVPPELCGLREAENGLPCRLGSLQAESSRLKAACDRENDDRPILEPVPHETRAEQVARQQNALAELGRRVVREAVQTGLMMDLEPDASQQSLNVFGRPDDDIPF